MQMKSSMTSIRVIYVQREREREKVNFKSREVNCLKECALALSFMVDTEILFSNMKYPSHECYSDPALRSKKAVLISGTFHAINIPAG